MRYKNRCITLDQDLFDHLEQTTVKHNFHLEENDKNIISMDKAVFLLDCIQYHKDLHKDDVVGGYINLHSKILNIYLKKELRKYKTFLKENGYIKTTPYKDGKSIGYKTSFYEKTGYKKAKKKNFIVYNFLSLTYEEYLSKAIDKYAKIEKKKKSADRTTRHLTKCLNEDAIQIDWGNAFKWIDSNNDLTDEQKESYSYAVNRIRFGDWYYSRSGKDNRLHSNLTNLPSGLRKFLSHNGQDLVSLDIKTSQPYMLAGIFNLLLVTNGRCRLRDLNSKLSGRVLKDKLTTVMNSITLDSNAITGFRAYINLICNTDIYNHIACHLDPNFVKTLEVKYEGNDYSDRIFCSSKGYAVKKGFKDLRDYCKTLTLEYMYSSIENNLKRIKQIKSIYSEAVNKFIHDFKYCMELEVPRNKRTKKQKLNIVNSKKLFPKLLQQLEAGIILDTITKELSKIYPKMFMATIHDSIVVPVKYKDDVKLFFEKSLFKIFEIEAKIKEEPW